MTFSPCSPSAVSPAASSSGGLTRDLLAGLPALGNIRMSPVPTVTDSEVEARLWC